MPRAQFRLVMSGLSAPLLSSLLIVGLPGNASAQDGDLDGLQEASGVNLTVEEGFGARHSGMAVTFAGFHRDADAAANAPAAMNDVDDFTFSTAHSERFGEAKFDDFAFLIPFESRSTLGLGLARYGVSGIELRPEGVSPLESQPQGLFSIADYQAVAAFARRFGSGGSGSPGGRDFTGIDVGAAFHLLYRQLDQDGLGMRGDAMAMYTWKGRLRATALLKGLVPSSARWESGYAEYEAPDLHLGLGASIPAPYFYGTLQVAWQSEGMFQSGGKSARRENGRRFASSPVDALAVSNAGAEFLFDSGLALRLGLSELGLSDSTPSLVHLGAGYSWRRILGLDYSFNPHPGLLASHRVSIHFTPAFPRFNGLGYRHGGGRAPVSAPAQDTPAPEEADSPAMEAPGHPEGAVAPPAPAPAAPPADAAKPSGADPAKSSPFQAQPTTAPKPAPSPTTPARKAPASQEVLEEETEEDPESED